jgi:hypothetical protein
MLKKEIDIDRNRMYNSSEYEEMLDFFTEELECNLEAIEKRDSQTNSLNGILTQKFYAQLQEHSKVSSEKIAVIEIALNRQILFKPGIQKILLKIAKEKLCDDIFAGKIQLFYNLEENKEDFEKIFKMRTKENGYELNPEIAEKLKTDDLKEYENKQIFLFFDILTDLVNTQDFKQILETYF